MSVTSAALKRQTLLLSSRAISDFSFIQILNPNIQYRTFRKILNLLFEALT